MVLPFLVNHFAFLYLVEDAVDVAAAAAVAAVVVAAGTAFGSSGPDEGKFFSFPSLTGPSDL